MRFLYTIIMVFLLASPASAQEWPCTYWFNYITLEENLPVAVEPDLMERYPKALSYPDGCTLVVFWRDEMGICYQIIDRYGELFYPGQPALAAPAISTENSYPPKAIPDGSGGAFIFWVCVSGSDVGMYAQRLDSLGNRLWGDAGVLISPDYGGGEFDISTDGTRGFLITVTYEAIKAFRIDGMGQHLWGDEGAVVCDYPYQQNNPKITHDGNGGAYVVWYDYRPPYTIPYGSLFMQRLDSDGDPEWTTNGVFIFESPWNHDIIPDGEGGFILHCGHGSYNWVYRIALNGTTLWSRDHVSWYTWAKIVEGEPGYFYLGFQDVSVEYVYAQRMDMQGHTYWPTLGSLEGAVMISSNLQALPVQDYYYRYPHFYGISKLARSPTADDRWLVVQKLDSLGIRHWGEAGIALSYFCGGGFYGLSYLNCVPDDSDGVVSVFETNYLVNQYDVSAKRCNADGTLGGPVPVKVKPKTYPVISGISEGQVSYTLPEAGNVKLDLFDLLGRKVKTIEEGYFNAGNYAVHYDRRDLASGVYFVRLGALYGQAVKKVVIVR